MVSPARSTAYKVLSQVERSGAYADHALNSRAHSGLERRDRDLATEIVYGTLRWRARLDYLLAQRASRPWNEVALAAQLSLRIGLYQMWFLERIPDHAIVHDAVELVKSEVPAAVGFVNGVLRALARERPWTIDDFERDWPLHIRVSLPEWIWKRWETRYGQDQARAFALALNQPPQPAYRLRGETGRESEPELPEGHVRSELVPGAILIRSPGSDPPTASNLQDEASQLIPFLLGIEPGWCVWDACAAPGGKAAILASLCGKLGRVISSDVSLRRARSLKALLAPHPHHPAIVVLDATRKPPFRAPFNAVLADVPCSGLGTLRRNPELKWKVRAAQLERLQSFQVSILSSTASSVGSGGVLLYSTCSTEPEENEEVVRVFLESNRDFSLVAPKTPSAASSWIGVDSMFRSFPAARPWDGFFAALMRRNS